MSILSVNTSITGTVGILPSVAEIRTSDTLATVLTTGYLNHIVQNGASFAMPCMALVSTQTSSTAQPDVGWFEVQHVGANWSLVATVPGELVNLPTIANHLAVFQNTSGLLGEDAAIAINGGSIQAGLSGTAGSLISYPGTAAKGSLILSAVANTGNTVTTLSNVAMGQASVISIPDPANAIGMFLVAATATPFTSGNLLKSSGTGGLVVDAGFAVKANSTTAYAGGGTSNAFTATGLTVSSIVTASILTSTNAVAIAKAVPTANTLTVTFTADPGANTVVSYIAITPAV